MVSAGAGFPWPVAEGDTRHRGTFGGDAVTILPYQRQGIGDIKRGLFELHPWRNSNIGLHAPNWKSRASAAKRDRPPAWGPLPVATMVLDFSAFLRDAGQPRALAHGIGSAANTALKLWHRQILPADEGLQVVDINRFDSSMSALAYRAMRSDRYWCPHDDDFLNWRFFAHPVFEYRAVGLVKADECVGYGVLRMDGSHAFLMEFVPQNESLARPLLRALIDRAREAGCNRMRLYNLHDWPFWPLFYRSGFRPRESDTYIGANCEDRPDATLEQNWSLMPSDSDVT